MQHLLGHSWRTMSSSGPCPDPILGSFLYDPNDEIKMQMESDAVQPCKLYFGEPGIRGRAVMTVAGEHEKERGKKIQERKGERKKERSGVKQPQWARKGVQGVESVRW